MNAKLFSPFTIKNITLKNRIVMSPMCMFLCEKHDGKVTESHVIHYSSRALGQVGLVMIEATAILPDGRISYKDLGIWNDEHIDGLKELNRFIHGQGGITGIQLSHAGRKAKIDEPIIAPSAIPFNKESKTPREMTKEEIEHIVVGFKEAARRAKEADFDVIEIHAAHGYLINQFLSPISNKRKDEYGGDFDRRYRFLEEIIKIIKLEWTGPLFVRISATDYIESGNTPDTYVKYAKKMKEQGVHLIDCSSGSVAPFPIIGYPGYQVPFADQIRRESHVATGAVGLITTGIQAEEILQNNRADLIFIGRELLRNPFWALAAAKELEFEIEAPKQYERAWNQGKTTHFLKDLKIRKS